MLLTSSVEADSGGVSILYGEPRFTADRVELLIEGSPSGSLQSSASEDGR